ncbi:tryptophan transporter [Paraclostridium sordellii]|uniref:Tryptophan transport protein n=1 Tax=Paraclostridium sordellii TaxID=1505 RepID=A0A9P1PAY0_PARSO|nr:tryptophan transporter [Paeniclostridium sordellii]CEO32751.1 tryptophan transport protein [[Clostridium] sordellii] [Paeniclostridium sordellii]
MKTRKLTINSILLAIGLILHQITPTLLIPMQPDFSVAMLIVIILLNKKDYKTCIISCIVTGVFTALTTKFPGGQVPNFLDKLITANLIYIIINLFYKVKAFDRLLEHKKEALLSTLIFPIGTLISGTTFLYIASFIVGLPASFLTLFITVILPTCFLNLFVGIFLYKTIKISIKRFSVKDF